MKAGFIAPLLILAMGGGAAFYLGDSVVGEAIWIVAAIIAAGALN